MPVNWSGSRKPLAHFSSNGAVAGDDLRLVVRYLQHQLDGRNHAVDRTPARQIDEGVHAVEESVAHVHHVGLCKVDDRVAVRVCGIDVEDTDLIAVQMKRDRIAEGHHWKRLLRRGRHLAADPFDELLFAHPLAHVLVGHDQCPGAAQVLVAARVVEVPVRVEHEADRSVVDGLHRRPDLVGQGRVLVVDEKDAVLPRRDAHVAPRADEHGDAVGQLDRPDLDPAEVLPRGRGKNHKEHQNSRDREVYRTHRSPPQSHETSNASCYMTYAADS